MFIVLCVWSHVIHAQNTYMWVGFHNDGGIGDPHEYRMYDYDIYTGEEKLLFSIDSSQLYHDNQNGLSRVIESFDFSPDRKSIYLLEREGDIYSYNLVSGQVTYITDITPENTNLLWYGYTSTKSISHVEGPLYYIGGSTTGIYNAKTKEFVKLSQPPNHVTAFDKEWDSKSLRKVVYHKGEWLGLDRNIFLRYLDFSNPDAHTLAMNIDLSGFGYGDTPIFSYAYDCDSSVLYAINKQVHNPARDSIEIDRIDIAEESVTRAYSYLSFLADGPPYSQLFEVKHYNAIAWEDCQVRIDLDEDNSTIEGIDYAPEELCGLGSLDLADTDFYLGGERRLDSLVFSMPPTAISYARIELPSGDYTRVDDGPRVILLPTETTTIDDFRGAIGTGKLSIYGTPTAPSFDLGITPWYNGMSGDTALARYRFSYPAPDAGVDTFFVYCADDIASIDIGALHSAMATKGGVLSTMDGSIINSPTDLSVGTTLLEYNVGGTSVCVYKAQIRLEIYENPVVPQYEDVRICYGTAYPITLEISDEVVWDDGDTSKEKVFASTGTYSYTVTNDKGCSATESFTLTISEAPQEVKKDTTLCVGDSLIYGGTTYTSPSVHMDSITSVAGCDSIITRIDIRYHEAQDPAITGTFGICPGSTTEIGIDGSFTWTLDGSTVTSPLTLDTAGSYELESIDVNNCKNTHTIEIEAYDRPSISVQDIIGIDYSEGIQLPVSYMGDINTYTWSPTQGIDCSDCPVPTLTERISTSYQITVVNADGCTAVDTIHVRFRDARYFLPNVVSINPNHPENGVFRLISSTPTDYELYIYDRWGNLVYENPRLSTTTSEGWKPRKDLVQGVYAYLLKFRDKKDGEKVLTGDVTVLRR